MSARSISMLMLVTAVVSGVVWLDVQYFAADPSLESRHDAGLAQMAARQDGILR
ncbi:hypothetical protein KF707_21655 [Candidatus Obscuribacterales bacterium]|nr:hypothetical protein [Candidatus Obscuribacterales bacterium]MBX3148670.1 hypothetical protein [Candidatus Obscuribacterales bacterium]